MTKEEAYLKWRAENVVIPENFYDHHLNAAMPKQAKALASIERDGFRRDDIKNGLQKRKRVRKSLQGEEGKG